jgi:hypothetical protein
VIGGLPVTDAGCGDCVAGSGPGTAPGMIAGVGTERCRLTGISVRFPVASPIQAKFRRGCYDNDFSTSGWVYHFLTERQDPPAGQCAWGRYRNGGPAGAGCFAELRQPVNDAQEAVAPDRVQAKQFVKRYRLRVVVGQQRPVPRRALDGIACGLMLRAMMLLRRLPGGGRMRAPGRNG